MSPAPGMGAAAARRALYAYVGAVGVALVAAQTMVLREVLVALYGTEFSIGMAMAGWLLGLGMGAAGAGLLLRRRTPGLSWFLAASLGYAVSLPASIAFVRCARTLWGIGPGEFVPLGRAMASALAATAVVAASGGFVLPVACEFLAALRERPEADVAAPVYVSDAAGTFAGGWLLVFVLIPHLRALQVAVAAASLPLLALAPLAAAAGRALWRRAGPAAAVACGLGWLLAGLCLWEPALEARTQGVLWRSQSTFALQEVADTRYQRLALGRREGLWQLYADGLAAASFPADESAALDGALYLTQHPEPRRVLWIGAGLAGAVGRVLDWRVERLDYVESDPGVLRLLARRLPAEYLERLRRSPALHVFACDARRFVSIAAAGGPLPAPFRFDSAADAEPAVPRVRYDLVIINMGDPASILENRLYTVEFYRALRGLMAEPGVVAVGPNQSAEVHLEGALLAYGACQYRTIGCVFPERLVKPGSDLVIFAANRPGVLTADPAELRARFERLGGGAAGAGRMLGYFFPPRRVADFTRLMAAGTGPVNRDTEPAAVTRFLRVWREEQRDLVSRPWRGADWLDRIGAGDVLLALLVLAGAFCLTALSAPRRRREAACGLLTLTTGFFGMTSGTLAVFMYQARFGRVYTEVGLLAGCFMAGVCAGGLLARRRLRRADDAAVRRLLARLEAVQAFGALAIACVLGAETAAGWAYFCCSAGAGLLVGLVFPLAAAVAAGSRSRPGPSVALLAAMDQMGAVAGALACGLVLMPQAGLYGAAVVVVGAKFLSGVCFRLLQGRGQAGA